MNNNVVFENEYVENSEDRPSQTDKKIKMVYGKGINDADYIVQIKEIIQKGKRNQRLVWICPYYIRWKDMLRRCYSEKYHTKQSTYIGCTVYDEWLYFSKFKAWMETQDWEGKQLDKDLLVKGNKVYSPAACVFISTEVNCFLLESTSSRGKYKIGVSWHKSHHKFSASCRDPFSSKGKHLGYFLTEEEAHQAWLTEKLEHAKRLAALQPDERVAKAIIYRYENYKELS